MKHLIALAMLLLVGCANTVTAPIPESSNANASSNTNKSSVVIGNSSNSSSSSVNTSSVMSSSSTKNLACIYATDSISGYYIETQGLKVQALTSEFTFSGLGFSPYGTITSYAIDSVVATVNSIRVSDLVWDTVNAGDITMRGTATGADTLYRIAAAAAVYSGSSVVDTYMDTLTVKVFCHAWALEFLDPTKRDTTFPYLNFSLTITRRIEYLVHR